MLIFAVLAVFIAGLMIGRTPEYLGKKIQSYEMKMVSIALLVTPLLILAGAAVGVMLDAGKAGISFPGRMAFRRSSTRCRRPPTTTAALLPAFPPTRRITTLLSVIDVVRPLRRDRPGAGGRRVAGSQETPAQSTPARCPRMARCSSRCWSARCC